MDNISMQSVLDETDYFYRDWYPALNVAPDGSLFHPGQMPELFSAHLDDGNLDTSVHSHGDRDENPRLYSTTVMYDVGKILVAGGGYSKIKWKTPPNLYDAAGDFIARPTITGGDSEAFPGENITVQGADDITEFNMVRLVAITHHHSTDQRFIPANSVKTSAGEYQLNLQANANVLIPEYYRVFGLDQNGTPFEGHTVHIKVALENEPPAAA
ncbi:MAG: hypothetical protein ACI9US_002123 [Gammaproteobacteria bacterium]|jgi:hypothetical protein